MDKKNLFRYMTVLMVGIFFFGSLALAQRKQKMEIPADIVFTNGKIYTVNNKKSFCGSCGRQRRKIHGSGLSQGY